MCLSELLRALRELGVDVTEAQVRWAIKSGRVTRPRLDGSLRFAFGPEHVHEIETYVSRPKPSRAVRS